MNKIKVMIADDQALMCDGLRTIINNEQDMQVVAVVNDGLKAFEQGCSLLPEVILMDVRMPVMDGVESVRLIKKQCPGIKVIMLTTFDDDEYILEALKYGANGYLLKSIPAEKLVQCIRDAVTGIFSMNMDIVPKFTARLAAIDTGKKEFTIDELTERETRVAELLAKGCSNREIAGLLFITEGTVKNYISIIYEKLGIKDRVKAAAYIKSLLEK